ncbi:MAG: sorbosone dehydrogenase family protein [Novosphingobium sp.]
MITQRRKTLIWWGLVLAALLGFLGWLWHGNPSERSIADTTGLRPVLAEPDSEFFPSVGLASPVGWGKDETPVAAKGLAVARFADGLDHPRTLLTLPNGDVLVAETGAPAGSGPGGLTGFFQSLFMGIVGAGDDSPNRIVLLRDANGDGVAESRFTLREKNLDSPSGMAWQNDKLYVANHDAVLVFDFKPGETAIAGAPREVMKLPAGGNHWMRNLLLSEDGTRLYVAVGSASNIAEGGTLIEEGRAAIWEIDLTKISSRQFAGGMRNPNGMAWNPSTGELWTVVNERDMLGPDLVPDYLTNVPVGAQYGWPWLYWGDTQDWRVREPIPGYLAEYSRKPEFALGAHTAPLGLLFSSGGNLMGPEFANGAFVARHGSWNRKPLVGYDVIFVPFDANGNPQDKVVPLLEGFLTKNGKDARGRPVWLAWDKAGALLVSDDTGGVIWRVAAPGATPSVRPKSVVTGRMPPLRSLEGDQARAVASFHEDAEAQ